MDDSQFIHVTTRGHGRRTIFREDGDFERFLSHLETAVVRYAWVLHAYCLMPNHYHLLLETTEPPGRGMKMLNGAYARYFNWRYTTEGHLWERKYHREPVARDEHLLEAFRYIARNPVKAGLCRACGDWKWSSYRATAGLIAAPAWLDVGSARELFAPYGGYADFCNQIAAKAAI